MRSVLGWVVLAPLIKRIEFIKSPKLLTLVTASESPTNLEGFNSVEEKGRKPV